MRRLSLPVGRTTPIVLFVILPAIYTTYILTDNYILLTYYYANYVYTSNIVHRSVQTIINLIFFAVIIEQFYYMLARPGYIERCLKQGLEHAIIEFETIKKVIPIILILVLTLLIPFTLLPPTLPSGFVRNPYSGLSIAIYSVLGIVILLTYSRIILRKEFRFYFADLFYDPR